MCMTTTSPSVLGACGSRDGALIAATNVYVQDATCTFNVYGEDATSPPSLYLNPSTSAINLAVKVVTRLVRRRA